MKKVLFITVAFTLLFSVPSFAKRVKYEVVDVKNGGSIKGKVKASEKVKDPVIPINVKPKEDPKETEKEKQACGSSQQAFMYVLSSANEVKNVFVIVEDVKKGKAAPKKDIVVDNIKCRFDPLVSVTYVKSQYEIKNSDPVFHNTSLGVMLKNKRRTVYNLALPRKDQTIKKPVRTAGLQNVKCDAHPWMRAYIYASRHPYVATTDAQGNFEIKDLLPGKYTVRFWHEGFEEVVKEIEVKAGKPSALNVTFTKTQTPAFMSGL